MTSDLYLIKEPPIATLVLNRPDKRNALTLGMWQAIPGLVREVEGDAAIKVLIVRGADERAFAAGADISEFETLRTGVEKAEAYNRATAEAETALATLSKPTIAMIQGFCIGGGCSIALSCDFRFADTTARFGITPARLGLVYGLPSTKRLVDVVGPSHAKYILFSGRQIDAQRAYEIGLINELHAPEDLVAKTLEFARTLCDNAQFSIRSTKRIIQRILEGQFEDDEETARLRHESFATDDYREGVRAFLEKRKPRFRYS
ncbi:MAG TPA: enoyl-CoA hydratase-related protein [Bacillota bacterium]